jgi:hypothetical protein
MCADPADIALLVIQRTVARGTEQVWRRNGRCGRFERRYALARIVSRSFVERAGMLAGCVGCSLAVAGVAGFERDSAGAVSNRRTSLNTASRVTDLTRIASAPAARARSTSAGRVSVVMTRIGTVRVIGSARNTSQKRIAVEHREMRVGHHQRRRLRFRFIGLRLTRGVDSFNCIRGPISNQNEFVAERNRLPPQESQSLSGF